MNNSSRYKSVSLAPEVCLHVVGWGRQMMVSQPHICQYATLVIINSTYFFFLHVLKGTLVGDVVFVAPLAFVSPIEASFCDSSLLGEFVAAGLVGEVEGLVAVAGGDDDGDEGGEVLEAVLAEADRVGCFLGDFEGEEDEASSGGRTGGGGGGGRRLRVSSGSS